MWRTSICAALLVSCQSPPVHVQSESLHVVAPTVEEAEWVTRVVRRFAPDVARMLDVEPVELRIEVLPISYGQKEQGRLTGGYTRGGGILLTRDALGPSAHVVLHEICHAYGEQTDWVALLPPFLEEGLCEFVSLSITGEIDTWRRDVFAEFRVDDALLPGFWSQASIMDAGNAVSHAYVYGFRVVDRAGIARIRSWAREGYLDEERVRGLFADGDPVE